MNRGLLDKAYMHCMERGHRFTPPRERVLRVLTEANRPLGAYDILQQLTTDSDKPNPPTVYRAIQFWHQEGFIHCIDSLKAYVVCCSGQHLGQTHFLICNSCDFVKEMDYRIDFEPLINAAESLGFSVDSSTVELKGLCVNCKKEERQAAPHSSS